jgi:hypothetical protein
MSKILVNCNLQTGEWTIREEDIQSHYTDVIFYFSSDEPLVTFNNLSFGLKLKKNGEELFTETFGTTKRFIACENTMFDNFLENCRLYLEQTTNYTLELWCENADIRRTYDYNFITPVEEQINIE